MNNNEMFRNEYASRLIELVDPSTLRNVLRVFDTLAKDYDINKQTTDIISIDGVPDVVKYYLASKAVENISKNTLKQYKYKLFNFFKAVRKGINDITANDIRLYLYSYRENNNASDCYLESIRVTLNSFFVWLVDNDYLIRNPAAKVEKIRFQPKPREALSNYELETVRWNYKDIREKAIVDFLYSTGVRVSECADVKLSDINWTTREVKIRHGKGNKERVVYFDAESEVTLREYLTTRKDITDSLFVSCRQPFNALGSHAIENIVKAVGERSGIKVYPHLLRHTFATRGIRGGMPLEKLQQLMGHTKPETTLIYAKLDKQDLQREHNRVYA